MRRSVEILNVSGTNPKVILAGHLSPFRYPGGKSWFLKTARKWLNSQRHQPAILVEPFAGGAGVSLAAVHERLVRKAIFAEIDPDVAATWKVLLNGEAKWLAQKILKFSISRRIVNRLLEQKPRSLRRRAFRCLVHNRTSRGGVMTKGAGLIREGENGKGLHSRWYPETLAKRITTISSLKERLEFAEVDGTDLIGQYLHRKDAVFFVDPPYTQAAYRLYNYWQIDHEQLFATLSRAKGAVLMMYDDTIEIRRKAKKYGFQFKSISMKTSHHQNKPELMIARNFNWIKGK